MNSADDIRSWSERLKKATRLPEVIDFCNAVIEFIGERRPKSAAEKKRDRNKYQRDYMRKYRKRESPAKRDDADMGDFAED